MFDRLGWFVSRHAWLVVLLWCTAAVLLFVTAPSWDERCQDDDLRFLPARCLSVQGQQLFREAFPRELYGSKVVYAFERRNGPLTKEDLALVDRLVAEVQQARESSPELAIGKITSHRDPIIGARYISADRQCTLINVALEKPFLAFRTTETLSELRERFQPYVAAHYEATGESEDVFRMTATGPAAIGHDLNTAAYASLEGTTAATLALVVVILLLLYRAPFLVVVPLITIGGAVWVSLRLLALVTLLTDIQLVNITRVFVVVVLFGAGTDYCLFLISRYREQLNQTPVPGDAIRRSLRRVGGALTASAATVVCGLGMMGFAEFSKLRYTGPAIAISLTIGLLAAVTLAPALLRLLGPWAFWPYRVRQSEAVLPFQEASRHRAPGFWERAGALMGRYPGSILIGTLLVLTPLAWLGWRTQPQFDITAELPRHAESREGMDILRQHFTPGELGPLTVLVQAPTDWTGPEGRALIERITTDLSGMPNVAEVRSLVRPLGNGVPQGPLFKAIPQLTSILSGPLARSTYTAELPAGNVTRLEVVFQTEPFAPESVRTMVEVRCYLDHQLRTGAWPSARYALYGITPLTYDIEDVHNSDRLLVNSLTVGGIFLILVLVVRRPLVAVYLLVSVLLSYYCTLGATQLLGYGWLGVEIGKVDWKIPFFLFTMLIAIGEDYNIFLMARVNEEARRHGMWTGTQRALARTGGTITSCGLIMAGTFATMLLCSLTTLAQLGLALALGVLLDTFVVRPVLVPAFLLWMYRRPAQHPATAAPPLRQSA